MKTESVIVRPFFKLPIEELQDWLDSIEIRFGDDDDYSILESATISTSARTCAPRIRITTDPPDSGSGVSPLHLTLTLSDEGRKMQRVLLQRPIRTIAPGTELECSVPAGIDWTSPQGAVLSMLVLSSGSASRELGLPFRKHSTVVARHIGINRAVSGEDFPIQFLGDSMFKELKYHPKTLAIVIIDPNDLQESDVSSTNIRVYVHEDLKGVLAQGSTSRKGRLATQIVMETVMHQIASVASEGNYSEGTFGHRVRAKLAKRLGVDDLPITPEAIRAATQGSFQLVKAIKGL